MAGRRIAFAAVVCAVLFAALTYAVVAWPHAAWLAGQWPGQGLADALFEATRRSGPLLQASRGLSFTGGDVVATVLVVGAVIALLAARHRALAAYLALSAVGSVVLDSVVKELVGRHRPPTLGVLAEAGSASYPSGHASAGIAVIGALGVVLIVLAHGAWGRVAGGVVIAVGVLIGVSRLALGVHWLTDVVGGWLLGTCVTCTAGWLVIAALRRR